MISKEGKVAEKNCHSFTSVPSISTRSSDFFMRVHDNNELSFADFVWGRQYAFLRQQNTTSSFQKEFYFFNKSNLSLAAQFAMFLCLSIVQLPTYVEFICDISCVEKIIAAVGLFFSIGGYVDVVRVSVQLCKIARQYFFANG
jgi:hypothetical protein